MMRLFHCHYHHGSRRIMGIAIPCGWPLFELAPSGHWTLVDTLPPDLACVDSYVASVGGRLVVL